MAAAARGVYRLLLAARAPARPRAGRCAAQKSWTPFLVGLALTPFALFRSHNAPSVSASTLCLVASPAWEYWRGLRTVYVVTNKRLIVLNGVARDSTASYRPSELGEIELREGGDGSGTVFFRQEQQARPTGRTGAGSASIRCPTCGKRSAVSAR